MAILSSNFQSLVELPTFEKRLVLKIYINTILLLIAGIVWSFRFPSVNSLSRRSKSPTASSSPHLDIAQWLLILELDQYVNLFQVSLSLKNLRLVGRYIIIFGNMFGSNEGKRNLCSSSFYISKRRKKKKKIVIQISQV